MKRPGASSGKPGCRVQARAILATIPQMETSAAPSAIGLGDFRDLMTARRLLREAVASESDEPGEEGAGWLGRVQHAAQVLALTIEEHRKWTEEGNGTLVRATDQKPGLMPLREQLEQEHTDLLVRIAELDGEVAYQAAAEDFHPALVRLEARIIQDILLLHLMRTNTMLFEAYVRVEGGEGG